MCESLCVSANTLSTRHTSFEPSECITLSLSLSLYLSLPSPFLFFPLSLSLSLSTPHLVFFFSTRVYIHAYNMHISTLSVTVLSLLDSFYKTSQRQRDYSQVIYLRGKNSSFLCCAHLCNVLRISDFNRSFGRTCNKVERVVLSAMFSFSLSLSFSSGLSFSRKSKTW